MKMKPMIYGNKIRQEIIADGVIDEFKYVVINYGTHPCCYVTLPKEHKLFGKNCGSEKMINNIECHGGITFCSDNKEKKFEFWNEDEYIIGWDFVHCGDQFALLYPNAKEWSTEELVKEVEKVVEQLINMK